MIDEFFFELIRVVLGTQDTLSRPPSAKEWKTLYEIAKKQSLVGVCFAAVQRLSSVEDSINNKPYTINLPEVMYFTWLGMAAKIQQRNEVVNKRCEELQLRLSKDGVKSCIIKGQCAARYYGGLALMRQSGDIDVWMEGGRDKVLEYVQSVAPTREVIMQHAHLHVFDDVEVEAHFSPSELQSPLHNRRLQKWFNIQTEKECHLVESGFEGPSAQFDAVFMLSHIYKHLMAEGIGMRQLMDYYFMLKSAKFSTEKKEEIMRLMKSFGMKRFAGAIMWILQYAFALEDDCLLCSVLESDGKLVLDEIMASGSFGHMDERRDRTKNIIGRLLEPRILTWRLAKGHPLEYLFTPIKRIKQKIWMMRHGYVANE